SWWIVHTQPTKETAAHSSQIPPTQLVDRSYSAYRAAPWACLPIPPTQLVDRSYSTCGGPIVFQLPLSYARAMYLEPFKEISWAFQLHYHICFRTHRRKTVFDAQSKIAALSQALTDLCKINDLHLLEKDCQPEHVQLLLSLRPSQLISDAMKRLKGRSSTAICQEFGLTSPLWARGYLARSVGRVRVQAVKKYVASQAAHHGYSTRALPPVFKFKAKEPEALATAHASFDLTHHLVLVTRFRRGVFDSKTGEALVNYWIKVAASRGFAVDQITVLPDHVHLIVRITPKISAEQVALSLMNNGQHFVATHFPLAVVEAKIDQLWQPSAYVGTCGELTTALLKTFLRRADVG
ncbi:MAG: IS200/IS605 family transposase, partial [Terriglobia bacterium]